jgi:hypothetical protein
MYISPVGVPSALVSSKGNGEARLPDTVLVVVAATTTKATVAPSCEGNFMRKAGDCEIF